MADSDPGRSSPEEQLDTSRPMGEPSLAAAEEALTRLFHDLRSPLNVIMGFAQVLQLDELGPKQAEAVDHIIAAGQQMQQLLDEAGARVREGFLREGKMA